MISDQEIRLRALDRPYIGGGYYNPPEDCLAVGRSVAIPSSLESVSLELDEVTFGLAHAWDELTSQVRAGEYLFGIFERRLFKQDTLQAVLLADVERLSDFEFQVTAGSVRRVAYVAMTGAQARQGLLADGTGE